MFINTYFAISALHLQIMLLVVVTAVVITSSWKKVRVAQTDRGKCIDSNLWSGLYP